MLSDKLKKIKLTDKAIFERYQSLRPSMSCEQSFLNLFCWQDSCETLWCEYENRLLVWYAAENLLLLPLGDFFPPEKLADILSELAGDDQGSIYDVPAEYLACYPETADIFTLSADEGEFDYIYETAKLTDFSGKKLRKKRNLIKQFYNNYPDCRITALSAETHDHCLELTAEINHAMPDLAAEMQALERFFAAFSELNGSGIAIYIADKFVGFSVVSQLNEETCCEHFEKVDHEHKGAAQVLVNETAKQLNEKIKYLNREQDMGIAGLRRAKRSYDPALIQKRYQLSLKKL
jgi:uncharacterized protein